MIVNFSNLGGTSCTINSFDQPPILSGHHSHASICHEKCPSTSCYLIFSHEISNSDLECANVKEYIHIETFSSPHLPICPTIHDTYTCGRDTQCSLASPSDELSPRLTQGNEYVHDEVEINLITECSSHSPSSLHVHEDDSSISLLKLRNMVKPVTEMAAILRVVLKSATKTILKPCMI